MSFPCTRVCANYSISFSDYSSAQSIPSEKSFLFSLKPFRANYGSTKFSLSPGKGGEAIRGDKDRGPCWGMATREMCFNPRDVKINPNGVFNDSGITGLGSFFTGQSSFQADDVEVLTIEGKNRNHNHHHHHHHHHCIYYRPRLRILFIRSGFPIDSCSVMHQEYQCAAIPLACESRSLYGFSFEEGEKGVCSGRLLSHLDIYHYYTKMLIVRK